MRAGIQAISRGQTEAAFALGLRPGRTMNLIILPQALRVIIPPLISQYLNLTKNTSLGIAVSYLDLRGTLGGITLNQTGRELECMLLMMLIYLTISLIDLGADEHLQQLRPAEGALRWPIAVFARTEMLPPLAAADHRTRRGEMAAREPVLVPAEHHPDRCSGLAICLAGHGVAALVAEFGAGTPVRCRECREIVAANAGEGATGACWAMIRERWDQFIFGFYPPDQWWRPILAFGLLFAALAPVLFAGQKRNLTIVLGGVAVFLADHPVAGRDPARWPSLLAVAAGCRLACAGAGAARQASVVHR